MSKANISKVSLQELESERGAIKKQKPAGSVYHAQNEHDHTSLFSCEYLRKLPIKDIESFFSRFGFVSCEKVPEENPTYINVYCEDFMVQFSDYIRAFVIDKDVKKKEDPKGKFDMHAFLKYCDLIEKTPEQVLSELMDVELFGQRYHSFSENRRKAKLMQSKLAFETLPKPMARTLSLANEQKENEINSTHNKLYYGSYAGNPYMSGFGDDK